MLTQAIPTLSAVLLAAILAGIVRHKHYRVSLAFTAYLLTMLVTGVLMHLVPTDRFYTRQFWLYKEAALNALKLAVALELAGRTLRSFPSALATARRVVFLVLVVTLLGVLAVLGGSPEFEPIAGELLPRIVNGTVWLFTAIAAVILWYRLPVHPFHKALLIGFVPYLLVFTTALKLFDTYGFQNLEVLNEYAYPLAYLSLLAYWTHAAWQRGPGAGPSQRSHRCPDPVHLMSRPAAPKAT